MVITMLMSLFVISSPLLRICGVPEPQGAQNLYISRFSFHVLFQYYGSTCQIHKRAIESVFLSAGFIL